MGVLKIKTENGFERIGGGVGGSVQGRAGGVVIQQSENATMIDYDKNVHSVNHRGYSASAPENTIPAYILSKLMGFTYVEADVSFTSDGVAVLLHDATIDRTSNGSGSISGMTYAEVSEYDFGSWKSSAYAGTKIATFDEFIVLCKRIGLHPYIELKDNGNYTTEQIQGLVATVKACGMAGKVTWISFSNTFLSYVKTADPTARLGYLASGNVSATMISKAQALRSGENEVFLDTKYSNLTDSGVQLCIDAGIPLEVWTVNTDSAVLALHPYITGVTSDSVIAGKTLYDACMVYTWTNAITTSETNTDPDPVPDEPTLLYNWDFTKSLTDTVSGQTAEISTFTEGLTAPMQDSNGVSLTAAEQYIYLCSVPLRGKTVEVDVANFKFSGITTAHIRFLMGVNRTDISSSTIGYGYLIWKKDFGWTSYLDDASGVKGWSGSVYGELSGNSAEVINYFSGKTVKCVFSDTGFVTLYADGELIGSLDDVCISTAVETQGKYMGHLYIGGAPTTYHDASSGNQCYDVTISAVRIYENP